MKTIKMIPFLIMTCILFSSCHMAVSKNPLSDPDTPVFDNRLQGLWGDTREGESVFLHFGKDKDDRTQIIYVAHGKNGSLEFLPVTMFPTVVEKNLFMNVRFLNEKGEMTKDSENYHFIKYDFPEPNTLSIAFIDSREIGAAIERGDIVGLIHKPTDSKDSEDNADKTDESTDAATITDRPENIVKFIKSADLGKLFPEPVILRKIE